VLRYIARTNEALQPTEEVDVKPRPIPRRGQLNQMSAQSRQLMLAQERTNEIDPSNLNSQRNTAVELYLQSLRRGRGSVLSSEIHERSG
jgi:hypothetical protein